LIANRVRLLLSIALVAALPLVARALMAQPAEQPYTVTSAALKVIYPGPKGEGTDKSFNGFSLTTTGLSIVYAVPGWQQVKNNEKDFGARGLRTSGLRIVYPSPSPSPKGK
jgi:hypothetical protein